VKSRGLTVPDILFTFLLHLFFTFSFYLSFSDGDLHIKLEAHVGIHTSFTIYLAELPDIGGLISQTGQQRNHGNRENPGNSEAMETFFISYSTSSSLVLE